MSLAASSRSRLNCRSVGHSRPSSGPMHQVAAQPKQPRGVRRSPRKVDLQVAVVDNSDHEQRQAHLPSAEYCGIHSTYGKSIDRKFAEENNDLLHKSRIESHDSGYGRTMTRTASLGMAHPLSW
jgi:hypothetical protein